MRSYLLNFQPSLTGIVAPGTRHRTWREDCGYSGVLLSHCRRRFGLNLPLVVVPGGPPAMTLACHTIDNLQPDLEVITAGCTTYAVQPEGLTAAAPVVALQFQTIAAANDSWYEPS